MFQRFVSKLRTGRPSIKSNTVVFRRAPLQKLKASTLSSAALTSLWAFNYFYNTQKAQNATVPSTIDSIDDIQEKCSVLGTPEEEAKTVEYLKKHLEIYRKLKGEKSDEVAVILMLLGSHCIAAGDQKLDGIRFTEQSCDIFLEIDDDKELFLEQLDDIAAIAKQITTEESIRLHEKTLAHKQKLKGEKSHMCIFNHLALGELYTILDSRDKANEHFEKAKNILDAQSVPADDPNDIYYEACEKFHTGNKLEDSHRYCKKALELLRKRKDPNDDEKLAKEGKTLDILAQNEMGMGSPEKSIVYLNEMDEFLEKTLQKKGDPYYFSKGQNFVKIGNIYFDKKDYRKALTSFQSALESFQKLSQNGADVLVYITWKTIADIYVALDEHKKAYETLNTAYQVARTAFGENHPNTKMDASLLRELEKKGHGAQ